MEVKLVDIITDDKRILHCPIKPWVIYNNQSECKIASKSFNMCLFQTNFIQGFPRPETVWCCCEHFLAHFLHKDFSFNWYLSPTSTSVESDLSFASVVLHTLPDFVFSWKGCELELSFLTFDVSCSLSMLVALVVNSVAFNFLIVSEELREISLLFSLSFNISVSRWQRHSHDGHLRGQRSRREILYWRLCVRSYV